MSDMTRRGALKLLAAAAGACVVRPEWEGFMDEKKTESVSPILSVKPLGSQWPTLDPFLFCAHHDDAYPKGNAQFGPVASLEGRNMGQDFGQKDGWNMYHGHQVPGFPQHPHRGFETVTVVRKGLLDHSDSLGATARFGGGDVQWLTAGKGILHSEMFPLLESEKDNPVELFQVWLNLPRANKLVDPHFSMFWNNEIPAIKAVDANGRTTEVSVIAGRLDDAEALAPPPKSWAADPRSDVGIWTVRMQPSAVWTLPPAPAGTHRMLYFFVGSELKIAGQTLASGHGVELASEVSIELEAGRDEVELFVLQGRPLNEPVAQYGPFVMNTRDELQQTVAEYQRTQFGGWPWERNDPVHAREGRFARHADGKIERPA